MHGKQSIGAMINNKKMDDKKPYISVIMAARNDNYQGDALIRLQMVITSLICQAKKYNLRVKLDGEWQLFVFPVQAFKVKRIGDQNLFEAEIIDPNSLFETSGGISRLTFIQAELKKILSGEKVLPIRCFPTLKPAIINF